MERMKTLMNPNFNHEFDSLVEKFSELLAGEASPELVEKVKIWSMYNHIHKTMPALTKHWNQEHPEAKADIRSLFEEIRDLNRAHREASE
jgi:hypothetical protein